MKKQWLTIVIIVGVAIFIGLGWYSLQNIDVDTPAVVDVDKPLKIDFALTDYDGNAVSLEDYIGKPLIVNSWAAWCPFCLDELPDFVTIEQEFEGQVEVIAINRAESAATAKKFTDELGVRSDLTLLLDADDAFYKFLGGFAMPQTAFVDATGNMVFVKRGFMDLDEIRQHTQNLLSR
jgi:thiol-disulfide isomerase/thioredoxin